MSKISTLVVVVAIMLIVAMTILSITRMVDSRSNSKYQDHSALPAGRVFFESCGGLFLRLSEWLRFLLGCFCVSEVSFFRVFRISIIYKTS